MWWRGRSLGTRRACRQACELILTAGRGKGKSRCGKARSEIHLKTLALDVHVAHTTLSIFSPRNRGEQQTLATIKSQGGMCAIPNEGPFYLNGTVLITSTFDHGHCWRRAEGGDGFKIPRASSLACCTHIPLGIFFGVCLRWRENSRGVCATHAPDAKVFKWIFERAPSPTECVPLLAAVKMSSHAFGMFAAFLGISASPTHSPLGFSALSKQFGICYLVLPNTK